MGAEVRGGRRDEFCCPSPPGQRHVPPELVQSPVLQQAALSGRCEAQHLSDLGLQIPSEEENVTNTLPGARVPPLPPCLHPHPLPQTHTPEGAK